MKPLASRQVHLDFHTSELIPSVGTRFNKQQFQAAIQLGRLNSITVFAKCHHSWCYYPTEAGQVHPSLKVDLLSEMIEAAHEIGVRAPVYIPVGWSSNDAKLFPQCRERTKERTIRMSNGVPDAKPYDVRPIVSWEFLCPSGPYAELIYEQTREVCKRYPDLDGLFYDICFHHTCYCEGCVNGMLEDGLDPDRDEDAFTYYVKKWGIFTSTCESILAEYHPDATLFFNGSANLYKPEWHEVNTHIEMEDLPTHWGGYDKMPLQAQYFAHKGKEYLGMTGKFHTMWGEFGGFKTAPALTYEVAAMMSYGSRCSVGDQLHPNGEMDMETYRIIGEAYGYAEQIEPWCFNTVATSRLGVMMSKENVSNEGMTKILLEGKLDFVLALKTEDLANLDVVIIPDDVTLDDEWSAALTEFTSRGGGILLTGTSGLDAANKHFLLDVGAEYVGQSSDDCDYLQLNEALLNNQGHNKIAGRLVASPFLCYEPAQHIRLTGGQVLADQFSPFFNRTYETYCSHQNTPNKTESDQPGAVRNGNIVYLAHPVFRMYRQHGMQLHRDYVLNALSLIYAKPLLRIEGLPSAGRARLVRQPQDNRYVLHFLYASPVDRGGVSIIEDMPPIYNVSFEFDADRKVRQAYLAPQGQPLAITVEGNKVKGIVPQIECHQMVVFDYE